MRLGTVIAAALALPAAAQAPFTLQQILSAPYSTDLTAAPAGDLFAWVEDAEGRHNLYVGGPDQAARSLTHNTEDDAQDISQLAWAPDGSAIAYTYGAPAGASGKPANPAHLQGPTAVRVIVQPLAPDAKAIPIGEGRSPIFLRGGCGVLYLQAGKIWALGLKDEPRPMSNVRDQPGEGFTNGVLDLPECDRAAGNYQLVFDRGAASQLTLSPDGNTLAFISRRSEANEPPHAFLALYDLRAMVLTFPAPSSSNDSAPAFSPDGHSVAFLRSPFTRTPEFAPDRTSPNPWSIQLLDLASHSLRTVFTPEANKPGSVLPHMATGEPRLFFASGNKIVFASEADGWVHLYLLDPATKAAPVLLTGGDGEVEDVSLSADRKEVFWASNIPQNMLSYGGLSVCMGPILGLEMADLDRRHLSSVDGTKPAALKPNRLADRFAADFERRTTGEGIETHPVPLADGSLVALASDSFVPMHPVYAAKDTGLLTDVRKDRLPETYPQRSLVFPEEVAFPFTGGTSAVRARLSAQLFLPGNTKASGNDPLPWCNGHKTMPPAKNPTKHPAILFLHGGPRRQMLLGYPAMDYYSNAYAFNQYLTSRGFIVLSLNYRCGIGYGLNFRQCLHAGATGAAEYNDVLAAQKYLASRPDVDASRIGVWGGSYGGYLTALALARNSNLFAAGVDFHGVHNWNLEDNADDWRVGSNAEKDALAARALASSPLGDIAHWRSPILLIHGDDDPEVAYAQTPALAEALRARNASLPKDSQVDVEDLIFPDEVHGFLLHRDWIAAYSAAAAFFERTLQP